jgi:hypothetical protein
MLRKVSTATEGKKPLRKVRKTLPKTKVKVSRMPFEGEVHGIPHPTRKGITLVHYDDAPTDRKFFPLIDPKGVPPKTYYAFDDESRRVTHLVSIDALGVLVSWDCDREFRYFTQARNPIRAPRSIEYMYDHSNAIAAGETWSHSHPNYTGSLASRRPVTERFVSKKVEIPTHRPSRASRAESAPAAPPKKLLRKKGAGDILTDKGLDTAKLDTAAEDMAARATAALTRKKPLRTLRKKA